MSKRSRDFAFTINNYTISDIALVLSLELVYKAKYLLAGFEVGDSGTPHIQGYVYFKDAKSLDKLKKLLPRAHVEVAKGSPWHNFVYCSEDGDYYEAGEYPQQGKASYKMIEAAMKSPEKNMQLYTQYRKAFREVQSMKPPPQKKRTLILTTIENLPNYIGDEAYADDDAYSGQKLVLSNVMYDLPDKITRWSLGIPVMCKCLGYEPMYYDPDTIVCYVDNSKDADYLLKKYKKYFDIVDIWPKH